MKLNFKNSKIHFTVSGTGNVVVLIHGFTESLDIWSYFSEVISKQYKVICIDLPGHGRSDCIGDIHTMDEMAEVVKAVLDNQNVEICSMIGHSMGGYVTLAFAENYPNYLQGFGLFHSSASSDSDEAKRNRSRAIEIIKNNHHNFLSSFIPDLFTSENKIKYKAEVESLIETAKSMTKEAVVAAQEGMKLRPVREHVLEKTMLPVLFIAGHKDSRIPIEKVLEQIKLPNNAYVLLLKDVAHMGYIEARELTLNFIMSFLDSVKIKF